MSVSQEVGARIRYYRNRRNLSLQALSAMIHKSVSTVSKYESGRIAIDVDTLYEIAQALSVSLHQLLEEQTDRTVLSPVKLEKHFFLKSSRIYAYYLSDQTIVRSVFLPVRREENLLHYDVFLGPDEAETYAKASFFLHAQAHCFDSGAAIYLNNPINSSDHGFIYVRLPFSNTAPITGLFTFSSEKIGMPICVKVLFSEHMIAQKKYLEETLSSNTLMTRSDLKKRNAFLPW